MKNSATTTRQAFHNGLKAPQAADRIDLKTERDAFNLNLNGRATALSHLTALKHENANEALKGNIENYIGMTQIPTGLAGPLLIRGGHARGSFKIPMATTEGALVASYSRGMKAATLAGGIDCLCVGEGVQRSPYFKFNNMHQARELGHWCKEHLDRFNTIVRDTSNYAQLIAFRSASEGNSVILTFEYSTGDAAGQNMVTICTDRICRYILSHFPFTPQEWYIESNYAGDKKATALSFSHVRGKKVTAEVTLSPQIVREVLRSSPWKIADYWQAATLAAIQSGSIGAQGHVANGLTAMFIACGQDVACVAEASVGITRMEVNSEGHLYAALTLPALIVGTHGGGTGLFTQKECLELLDCYGPGKAQKFAEICTAVALAGELSIAAAMSVDHFTAAHEKLGRK